MSNRKRRKEEQADPSQKGVCHQDRFCNIAYQELEEMSQQQQYDEISCRDVKVVASEVSNIRVILKFFFIQIHFLVVTELICCYTNMYTEFLCVKFEC